MQVTHYFCDECKEEFDVGRLHWFKAYVNPKDNQTQHPKTLREYVAQLCGVCFISALAKFDECGFPCKATPEAKG